MNGTAENTSGENAVPVVKRVRRKRNYTVQVGLMISTEMNNQLCELATNGNCSIQDIIRELINLGLDQKEGKN